MSPESLVGGSECLTRGPKHRQDCVAIEEGGVGQRGASGASLVLLLHDAEGAAGSEQLQQLIPHPQRPVLPAGALQ